MVLLLAIKTFFTEILKYWKQLLILALVLGCLYGTYNYGVDSTTVKFQNNELKLAKQVASDKEAAEIASAAKLAEFNKNQDFIVGQYVSWYESRPIIKEVTKYVTKISDAHCVIPAGFVRVHDSAAAGKSIGGGLDTDDSPTTINLSTVAETVATNYDTCNLEMKKLNALQEVVTAYKKSQKQ